MYSFVKFYKEIRLFSSFFCDKIFSFLKKLEIIKYEIWIWINLIAEFLVEIWFSPKISLLKSKKNFFDIAKNCAIMFILEKQNIF